MNFSTGKTLLSTGLVKPNTDEIGRALNFAKQEVSKYALWNELVVPNAELNLVPDYTTGTVNITEDSRVVVLVGGSVSSEWKGRYLNVKGVSYEIRDVDTANNYILLKSKIIDKSETGLNFSVYKIYYRLPTDIRVVLPSDQYEDMPSPLDIKGYDDYAVSYSLGNLTFSKDSSTAVGDGTQGQAFLDNVYSGDIIKIQNYFFRVKRVLSDTQIEMVNKSPVAITTSYSIYSDTPYKGEATDKFRIWGSGSGTRRKLIQYSYIRTLYDMVSDLDTTELSPKFDQAILDIAKGEYGRSHPDQSGTWKNDLQVGLERLKKLENDKELVFKSSQQFRLSIPMGMGRGVRR